MPEENEKNWVEIDLTETTPPTETSSTPEVQVSPEIPEVKIEEEVPETPEVKETPVQEEKKKERAETRIRSLSKRLREAEEARQNDVARLEAELLEARQQRLDGAKSATDSSKVALAEKIKATKVALAAAYNNADPEAIANSIEELTQATAELQRVNAITLPEKVEAKPTPKKGGAPEALQEWLGENQWFVEGPKQDRRAALMASQIGDEMVKEGGDLNDPDFYVELDKRLKEELPRLKSKPVVATSSRTVAPTPSGTRPGVVRLTADEVKTAEFFGMTPKEFAMAKLNQSKGENGYTEIK